jgi:hypothetical protein
VAGRDAAARALFVAMQQHDTGFLTDTANDPARAGDLCAALCQQLFQRLYANPGVPARPLELAELAPLLLVAGDPRTNVPPQSRFLVANFLYQPPVRAALANDTPFKKLVLAWMDRQTDDEDALQQMFFVVANLDLREGVDVALKVIRRKKARGVGLASALTTVGKLGGKQHRAVLEPFLTDTTAIGNFALNRERGTTQMRDVALAMLVHLTGQDHKGYGFAFAQSNPHLQFYPNFLGFTSDEQRARAFARWKEWSAAH